MAIVGYERSYATARRVASIIEILSWIAVGFGINDHDIEMNIPVLLNVACTFKRKTVSANILQGCSVLL